MYRTGAGHARVRTRGGRGRVAGRRGGPGQAAGERQLHPEGAAAIDLAFDPDGAAHRLGQRLRQRQPESRAFDRGLIGVQPLEGLKEPGQFPGRDPGARVTHADAEAAAGYLDAGHAHAAAGVVVLDGVR